MRSVEASCADHLYALWVRARSALWIDRRTSERAGSPLSSECYLESTGRPKAGQRADVGALPVAVRPKCTRSSMALRLEGRSRGECGNSVQASGWREGGCPLLRSLSTDLDSGPDFRFKLFAAVASISRILVDLCSVFKPWPLCRFLGPTLAENCVFVL